MRALDEFARENIYALYKFNFSDSGDTPGAQAPGPESEFQLDRTIRLQRLSRPDGQNEVGFRLVSEPRRCGGRGRGRGRGRSRPALSSHPYPSATAPAATASTAHTRRA